MSEEDFLKHVLQNPLGRFMIICYQHRHKPYYNPKACAECRKLFREDPERAIKFFESFEEQLKLPCIRPKKLSEQQKNDLIKLLSKYWKCGYRNRLTMSFIGWALKNRIDKTSVYDVLDKVTTLAKDEERKSRLKLIDYHYRKYIPSDPCTHHHNLTGVSGLKEAIKEIIKQGEFND